MFREQQLSFDLDGLWKRVFLTVEIRCSYLTLARSMIADAPDEKCNSGMGVGKGGMGVEM